MLAALPKVLAFSLLIIVFVSVVAAEDEVLAPILDPSHIATGRWSYRLMNEGRASGAIVVEISSRNGVLTLHDRSTMGETIEEEVLLRFDQKALQPLSWLIHGSFDGVRVVNSFTVEKRSLRGKMIQYRPDGSYREVPVDVTLGQNALLRGAAIWLAHAMPIDDGRPIVFDWFAGLTGQVEQIRLTPGEPRTIEVPAGSYDVIPLTQQGGTPGNVIYVTTGDKRQIVKVDVVGRPMTIELESFTPSPP